MRTYKPGESQANSPPVQLTRHKGRGAVSNLAGRYQIQTVEAVDDGWAGSADADCVSAPTTEITFETAKSILTRNQSPDIPFNISLNPYRGCEHGCIYCYARPSHSYLGLSPGLDFETRIFAKINAPGLLREELAKAKYQPEPIAVGVNTDAYQPCERKLQLTRKVLQVMRECRQPFTLTTKNALVERDLDILSDMAAHRLTAVLITLTTLDHTLARTLEPRATAPIRRLATIEKLAAAGVPVAVNVAPIIPFINDCELESILHAAADAGASRASYIIVRLPWEVSPLFQQWLQSYFPDRATRVMNRIREMRGGKDYKANFGTRMRGDGMWADVIRQRFKLAQKKFQLLNPSFGQLDCALFQRPGQASTSSLQADLFDR